MVRRSHPSVPTLTARAPAACDASVCSQIGAVSPAARRRSRSAATTRAISRTGCTAPTSPLASSTETSLVKGVMTAATSAARTRPSAPTPTTAHPPPAAAAHASTLSCSAASTTTWAPSPAAAKAKLFASVAPAVKVTLPGRAPIACATAARAASTSARTARAAAYGALGFSNFSLKYGSIAATTSESIGVAAA